MASDDFRLGVVASALSVDPRSVLELSRGSGFKGVLFDAFSPTFNMTELSATGAREFRHLIAGQDQQLVGLRVDLGPRGFGPGADVDRLLFQLDKVLRTASALGAPLVCAELGPLPAPPRESKPKPAISADEAGLILIPSFAPAAAAEETEPARPVDPVFVAQVDGAMAEVGGLADRYNVMLAFRSELSSFAALERSLSAARCPWFGLDLDPVSILQDEWEADEIFSRLGNHVRHVRGRDAIRGADRRTKPASIGRGDTRWDRLLSNLKAAGYHQWITLDPVDLPDRSAAAIAGFKFLKLQAEEG